MFKNVASQKVIVFAYDVAADAPKTGDAANITANVSKDGAAPAGSDDTNPTEIGGGLYVFDLTQAESNADLFALYAASATANVKIDPVIVYTRTKLEIHGSVTNASPTTTTFRDSTKSATADFYNGAVVAFTSGTLQGLARKIEDYDGSTKEFTVDALPAAPAQNDTFVILGRIDE